MEPIRKRQRGKRAGRNQRESKPLSHHHSQRNSATGLVADAAVFFHGSEVEETAETHIVPRQSLTASLGLGLFPQDVETEVIKTKQRDKDGNIVEVEKRRQVWKSDKTLLRRNNPFADYEERNRYKREGAIREGNNTQKYTATEKQKSNEPVVIETVTDEIPGLDKL